MHNTPTSPIEQACNILGGQSFLARLLNISPGAVNQWVRGVRPIPAIHCPAIEQATAGEVSRKDLHPDDWHLIWPELVTDNHDKTDQKNP